jgi:hypothetical protein
MDMVDKVREELRARQIRRHAFLACFVFWALVAVVVRAYVG